MWGSNKSFGATHGKGRSREQDVHVIRESWSESSLPSSLGSGVLLGDKKDAAWVASGFLPWRWSIRLAAPTIPNVCKRWWLRGKAKFLRAFFRSRKTYNWWLPSAILATWNRTLAVDYMDCYNPVNSQCFLNKLVTMCRVEYESNSKIKKAKEMGSRNVHQAPYPVSSALRIWDPQGRSQWPHKTKFLSPCENAWVCQSCRYTTSWVFCLFFLHLAKLCKQGQGCWLLVSSDTSLFHLQMATSPMFPTQWLSNAHGPVALSSILFYKSRDSLRG